MMKTMVSIIVPVYKVEQYLPQCIESIINQIYRDLEIILVDDESPDSCGKICDEYAEKDKRIKVYHKENGGLSDARNYGIMMARGEYLGFVDSDDWLEPDMFETLVRTAEENNADIVSCGFFREYPELTVIDSDIDMKCSDTQVLVKALLSDNISAYIWNKLYHKSCFSNLTFPKGHDFEDISTLYRIFLNAATGISISTPLYHYRMNRAGSISQTRSIDNLIDYWIAHKSRYDYFLADNIFNTDQIIVGKLRYKCAVAISRTWRWCYASTLQEVRKRDSVLEEMQNFANNNLTYSETRCWPLHLQFTVLLAKFKNPFVFAFLYFLNQAYRRVRNIKNGYTKQGVSNWW